MEEFACTVKFNNKPDCKPSDYLVVFKEWEETYKVRILERSFEADSRGICHSHLILLVPQNFYRKKLNRFGLHISIKPIVDREGWLRYMYKSYKLYPIYIKPKAQGGSN